MKGADEVLSMPRIDSRLAAHAGIDLGEQRRRDLHQAHAPAQRRGAKSGKIADDPAAKGNDNVSPLDARLDQRIGDAGELGIRLGALAGRADDRCGAQTRSIQACRRADRDRAARPCASVTTAQLAPRRDPGDFGPRLVENAWPDQDRIGARAERNFDPALSAAARLAASLPSAAWRRRRMASTTES